jgi:putative FmdB family regulatory protein
MPTYQYRCTACGEDLEAVQKFSDAPLTVCPSCGGHLRKIFNAVGVVFKGSGFYRTDSRNGSKTDGADSGSSEKKSPVEKKSAEKESAGAGSAASPSSSNGKQSTSGRTSSTGEKASAS